ncbi:hypothetical protein MKX03_025060, partial [Papaver bracteatum]
IWSFCCDENKGHLIVGTIQGMSLLCFRMQNGASSLAAAFFFVVLLLIISILNCCEIETNVR